MNLLDKMRDLESKPLTLQTEIGTGITMAYILAARHAGIIRPKGQDPFEGELLLVASRWGTSSEVQDLTSLTPVREELRSIEDARKLEPGMFRYYLVVLQGSATARRTGSTPIHVNHLASGRVYVTLDEAVQAFQQR